MDALSAKIEMELGELEPDEAAVFMEELGLAESSLDRVIRRQLPAARPDLVPHRGTRRGAGLADPRRVHRPSTPPARSTRTWPAASSAPRSCRYEDLLASGPMAEARKHGKLRSEGKTYRVSDGDVIEILFSR